MMAWAQTIISACAAIDAIAAALVTWWVYCYNRKPDVVAYLEHPESSSMINLTLKSMGSGMAYDVTIDNSVLPCSPPSFERCLRSLKYVSVLAPGTSRSVFAFVPGTGDAILEGTFGVKVAFASCAGGRKTECAFELEYESLASELRTIPDATLQRKAIENMEKSRKGLLAVEKERAADIKKNGVAESVCHACAGLKEETCNGISKGLQEAL